MINFLNIFHLINIYIRLQFFLYICDNIDIKSFKENSSLWFNIINENVFTNDGINYYFLSIIYHFFILCFAGYHRKMSTLQ